MRCHSDLLVRRVMVRVQNILSSWWLNLTFRNYQSKLDHHPHHLVSNTFLLEIPIWQEFPETVRSSWVAWKHPATYAYFTDPNEHLKIGKLQETLEWCIYHIYIYISYFDYATHGRWTFSQELQELNTISTLHDTKRTSSRNHTKLS